ncbi:hypothetical protein AB1K83_07015 [Sporosarcina sp. 179-K 3D1 HS]|uniref:hypothetical protein n=1 Tax=Sporosarcina sp. 179-K 3D1 HS TaxID=3232169 RepID=UPI00399FD6E9
MKFGKRYSKMTVFVAMLHGVLIGIAAVAVIGFLMVGTKGKETAGSATQEVPTGGPAPVETTAPAEEQPIRMYAKQHGAFSSSEAASAFIAEQPALAKAAIIQADNQFYVWSAIGLKESEIEASEAEGTYRKAFSVETAACQSVGAGQLKTILTETDIGKVKTLASSEKGAKEDSQAKVFSQNISAITAFTEDLRIVRLHLLSHYSHTDKCAKISF